MKKILPLIICGLFSFNASRGENGIEKIIVEKYYVSDEHDAKAIGGHLPPGSITYRIYVDMLPGYRFEAAYGVPGHELKISTSTTFFNNEDYGSTVANVIPDRNLNENSVMLDSWLSVGAASEFRIGILKSSDDTSATVVNAKGFLQNENPAAGIPLKKRDGMIFGDAEKVTGFGIDSIVKIFGNHSDGRFGNIFSTENGSWASMNGSVGPTPDNQVLIAQITTDGIFSFELNIQIGTPGGSVQNYVARHPSGSEIQIPSLIYTSADPQVRK